MIYLPDMKQFDWSEFTTIISTSIEASLSEPLIDDTNIT